MTERKRYLNTFCTVVFTGLLFFLFGSGYLRGEIYFKDSDRQLEVIRINGEQPGLTVLIFGGIHGDEPGGYFSSEILSKVKMIKGNLIVVPRVNFPSIMLYKRDLNGDLNRKFGDREKPGDPDIEIVKILKSLMKEADVFINQHDAYGFHRETFISPKYNYKMYGQSLIIDCARFYSDKLKKQVELAQMGKSILERVNRQISNKDHHFGFWDHDSVAHNTRFPEMKKSATYYALTTFSIPAFGLETSKDLPSLNDKVKYQLIVIREILHEFGLEGVFPSTDVATPEMYWIEFLKNNKDTVRVNPSTNLRLNSGDIIIIKNIVSNYDNGLSADIMDWGSINDVDKEFRYSKPSVIQVKKNHLVMGKIFLQGFLKDSIREISVEVNGKKQVIPNWGKVEISRGETFKILGTSPVLSQTRFDIRGFNAPGSIKDDSNIVISFEKLLPEYSFLKKGSVYFVKVYSGTQLTGGFQVEWH